jgi:outer membrane lipoprotein-sorting protein
MIISLIPVSAQSDPEAKTILEKVSSKNNSYKTIMTNFKYTITSMQDNETHTEKGKIAMKGDQFHLSMGNTDITFDGKNIYTYLKEANEINITKPEPSNTSNGDFFLSNPRDLFKVKNDFKAKLNNEINIGSITCYEIDLYPVNLKTKYLRIRTHIDKNTFQIIDTKIFMKDGTNYLIELSNFQPNINISGTEFLFDQKKYPGAMVNDIRF